MIRLRLSDVEDARQRPSGFRGGSPPGSRMSFTMARALQYSVYEYHRQGGDLARAAEYFENMFRRNFRRQGVLLQLLDQLAQYHAQFQSLSNTVVRCRVRVAIAVGGDMEITGEIGRLDLAPDGGYAAWLLARTRHEWRSELRMPLIQGYFARQMVVEPENVAVGFYFFDPGEHDSVRFSARQIDAAFAEAHSLSAALAP